MPRKTANDLDIIYTMKVAEILDRVLDNEGPDPNNPEKSVWRFHEGWADDRVAAEVGTDVGRAIRIRRAVKGELALGRKPRVAADDVSKLAFGYRVMMKALEQRFDQQDAGREAQNERIEKLEQAVQALIALWSPKEERKQERMEGSVSVIPLGSYTGPSNGTGQ